MGVSAAKDHLSYALAEPFRACGLALIEEDTLGTDILFAIQTLGPCKCTANGETVAGDYSGVRSFSVGAMAIRPTRNGRSNLPFAASDKPGIRVIQTKRQTASCHHRVCKRERGFSLVRSFKCVVGTITKTVPVLARDKVALTVLDNLPRPN